MVHRIACGASTSAPWSSSAPSFRPGACKIILLKCNRSVASPLQAQARMNLRGNCLPMSQKRTLRTWGRRGRGQIKNACAQDQKGEEWGAAQQPSSEGRERRRRRAEDVGVVLGEAARVRDVGLFHQSALAPSCARAVSSIQGIRGPVYCSEVVDGAAPSSGTAW